MPKSFNVREQQWRETTVTGWTDEQRDAFRQLNEDVRQLIFASGLPVMETAVGLAFTILAAIEDVRHQLAAKAADEAKPTVQ